MTNLSTIPLIINGEEISTSNLYPVYSHKHSQDKICDFSYLSDYEKQIPEICGHAEKGLEEWSSIPFNEKRNILKKALELLVNKRDELVESHKIIGGPVWFSEFNVEGAVGQLEEYISQLSQPDGVIPKSNHCELALSYRQPIGTVLSISPWNAPVILGMRSIVGPLAAGCSVIVKSSDKSPHTAYLLVKCFLDAGVPKKALQLVHLKPEDNPKAIELFLGNKAVKKVHFTGSTSTGRAIATTAARYLKPCMLELGGKNYSIVEEDADLDKASKNILWSAWCHMGQICMSTDKTYVHESVYDKFLTNIKTAAESMMKDPEYNLAHRDEGYSRKVGKLVSDAISKGAKIEFGSETKFSKSGENVPVTPLIITNVTSDMLIDSVETFGPVLSVYKYNDSCVLVDELNNDQSCLKTAIWSKNTVKALRIAKKIQCGGIHINSSTVHDEPTIAHGGIRESGQGRINSSWGIEEFSYVKTITIDE
mmetsp:Transcript_8391/g.10447  ORF Transcript_8391/g.10447 Transcript_8391/m.10447 type:complete len:480 (+) Transcript_8391:55-1494(+)